MTPSRSFQDLQVWQKAHRWVLNIYHLSAKFPREEMFGLSSQLRRAAVSVPANIAEGFVKRGQADKIRFYNISQGSLEEARYYLILVRDLGYGDTVGLLWAVDEISRMLESYIRSMQSRKRLPFWLLAAGSCLLSYSTSVARG